MREREREKKEEKREKEKRKRREEETASAATHVWLLNDVTDRCYAALAALPSTSLTVQTGLLYRLTILYILSCILYATLFPLPPAVPPTQGPLVVCAALLAAVGNNKRLSARHYDYDFDYNYDYTTITTATAPPQTLCPPCARCRARDREKEKEKERERE